jgi:GNAT superfamily N-acetyltransferase
MRIRQLARHELRAELARPDQPWLQALCVRLRDLPPHPHSRVLIAEENGRARALLGLRLYGGGDGRLLRVTISVLGVDPAHNRQGIGSRLVRFAEGIARINGCTRVDVASDVEGWADGRCWTGLGYDGTDAGFQKVLGSPIHGTCV